MDYTDEENGSGENWETHFKKIIRPLIMDTEKDLRRKAQSARIKETISIDDQEGKPVIKGIALRISVPAKGSGASREHEIRFRSRSEREISVSYSGIEGLEEHDIDLSKLNTDIIREELRKFSSKVLE
mgnify:CR=1 FL=1